MVIRKHLDVVNCESLGYIRKLMVHRFVKGWIGLWLHVIG